MWISWIKYISFIFYGYGLLTRIEFGGREIYACSYGSDINSETSSGSLHACAATCACQSTYLAHCRPTARHLRAGCV